MTIMASQTVCTLTTMYFHPYYPCADATTVPTRSRLPRLPLLLSSLNSTSLLLVAAVGADVALATGPRLPGLCAYISIGDPSSNLHLYARALRISVRIRPRLCICWLKTLTWPLLNANPCGLRAGNFWTLFSLFAQGFDCEDVASVWLERGGG